MISNYDLPNNDHNYIEDTNLFIEIKNELTRRRLCYVYGVPVVGKSSFAIELANQLNERYVSIWFDCASEVKVKESVKRFAASIDIHSDDLRDSWIRLKNKLTQMTDTKFLFILDNVEQYEHVKIISDSLRCPKF